MEPVKTAQAVKTASKTAWSVPTKVLARSVQKITLKSMMKALASAEVEALRSSIQHQIRISAFVKTSFMQRPKAA